MSETQQDCPRCHGSGSLDRAGRPACGMPEHHTCPECAGTGTCGPDAECARLQRQDAYIRDSAANYGVGATVLRTGCNDRVDAWEVTGADDDGRYHLRRVRDGHQAPDSVTPADVLVTQAQAAGLLPVPEPPAEVTP